MAEDTAAFRAVAALLGSPTSLPPALTSPAEVRWRLLEHDPKRVDLSRSDSDIENDQNCMTIVTQSLKAIKLLDLHLLLPLVKTLRLTLFQVAKPPNPYHARLIYLPASTPDKSSYIAQCR